MVEYNSYLDAIFTSLADHTRRDILSRLMKGGTLSITEIAQDYKLTFAAVSKHLMVLEKAKLVSKHRKGLKQMVSICPEALQDANHYLAQYEKLWQERFDRLESLINNEE